MPEWVCVVDLVFVRLRFPVGQVDLFMNRRRYAVPVVTAFVLFGLLLGAGAGAAQVGHGPRNRSVPRVLGSAVVGRTLVASHGRWTRGPRGYGYRWLRCDAAWQAVSEDLGCEVGALPAEAA